MSPNEAKRFDDDTRAAMQALIISAALRKEPADKEFVCILARQYAHQLLMMRKFDDKFKD